MVRANTLTLLILASAFPAAQAARAEPFPTETFGVREEWTAVVGLGGSMEVMEKSRAVLKSPFANSICFLQRTVPVEGDYVFKVAVRGVRSNSTGGILLGACKGPLPVEGNIGTVCDARYKAYWYPYGWLGVARGDHALVTVQGSSNYVNWDGKQWVHRWARTGVATSPEATYTFRLERRDRRYSLSVRDGNGKTILLPRAVEGEALNGGLGPDTLVIGDPWSKHTAMELEVLSVSVNEETVDFGEAGQKVESDMETSGDEQIQVTVGKPFTISSSPSHYNFPTLKQLGENEAFVAIWASADASLEADDCDVACVWTEDGGKSWDEPVVFHGSEGGGHSWIRRKDGTCVWLRYFCRPIAEETLSCDVGFSEDGRNYIWSVGKVTFPEPVKPWTKGNAFMVFARSILELDDGSLLATMYGYFDRDAKYRSLLVRSTDGGTNWDYYSTMAFSLDAPGEGCCEPVIARTSAGELLCVMRVGSNLPMWVCRSANAGKTWSDPHELPFYSASVFPDMLLLANGILAVSFGRPGAHIMFSVDGEGRRWTLRTTIHDGTNTDAYTAIREVAPGRLLYVFHENTTDGSDQPVNAIRGVFVQVERK